MSKVKKIKDAAAFLRDTGLLFEINRKILHPLGMALETQIADDGTETFGALWDCRDDPEGMIYNDECYASGLKKFKVYMKEQGNKSLKSRIARLNYLVQGRQKG